MIINMYKLMHYKYSLCRLLLYLIRKCERCVIYVCPTHRTYYNFYYIAIIV